MNYLPTPGMFMVVAFHALMFSLVGTVTGAEMTGDLLAWFGIVLLTFGFIYDFLVVVVKKFCGQAKKKP